MNLLLFIILISMDPAPKTDKKKYHKVDFSFEQSKIVFYEKENIHILFHDGEIQKIWENGVPLRIKHSSMPNRYRCDNCKYYIDISLNKDNSIKQFQKYHDNHFEFEK